MARDIRECIAELKKNNIVDDQFERKTLQMFDRFVKATDDRLQIPLDQRVSHASEQTIALLEGELQHKNRVKLGTLVAKMELEDYLRNAPDPFYALEGLISPRAGAVGSNLYLQEKVILNQVLAPFNDLIIAFQKGNLLGTRFGNEASRAISGGQRDKLKLMEDMVEELYKPGSTKNKVAAKLAKQWTEASENMRLLFNKAGGNIAKNERWALPQSHHTGKIAGTPKAAWKKFITPLLDRNNMLDNVTGLRLTDNELDNLLDEVYESIRTEGRNKVDNSITGNIGSGSSIANRHREHRVLNFKDGASYMKYQNQYGTKDIFDVMMNHMRSMAKDISSMQVLGPNAESTVKFLKASIRDIADGMDSVTGGTKNIIRANKSSQLFDNMWQVHKGLPEAVNPKTAAGLRNLRALLMATKLQFTPLIAFPTDAVTTARMAQMNGMSPWKAVGGYIANIMRIGNVQERSRVAAELGLLNEAMMDGASAAMARYLHEDNASPLFQFLADSSLRLNGLTHITQSGRHFAGQMLMGNYAKNVSKTFDELDDGIKKGLLRYGIDDKKWGLIRRAKLETKKFGMTEVEYLTPGAIMKISGISSTEARDLSDNYLRLILGETEVAVPTVTTRQRAQLGGTAQAGTIPGEIARSFAMFKSWPFAFYHSHLHRKWVEATTPMQKLDAIAGTMLFMTMGGALGLQLYAIASGEKPRETNPFNDPKEAGKFWFAALSRSGGWGPLGDILSGFADFQGGLSSYVSGPTVGAIDRIGYTIFGSAQKAVEGKDVDFATRSSELGISLLPYHNNWMTSLIMKRLFWENALLWGDPNYQKKINQKINQRYREGQEFWWKPGEMKPTDSPFD